MSDAITDIKKLLKEEMLIVGTEETLKGLRSGEITKVFLAVNAPDEVRETIQHYAEIEEVEIVDAGVHNDELGDICKKPFSIAVLGLKK
jgi:ribosomal protein L30E